MDILDYLESQDVELKVSGHEAHTHCFFCDEDTDKAGRLYFNIDSGSDKYGLYHCFLCDASGGPKSLLKHFGDDPSKIDAAPTPQSRRIFSDATAYYHQTLLETPKVYDYLTYERGLSDETIDKLKLGYADGGLLQHLMSKGYSLEECQETGLINRHGSDFLEDQIAISYLEYGVTTTIRGKKIGEKYWSLPGSTASVFGLDYIRGERDVIITAGEFDAAVLQQLGFAACGVPGENIWKDEWMDYFEDAGRVFILYDNDRAGKAGAEKVASVFGPRARVVEFPPSRLKLDVSEYVVGQGKNEEDIKMLLVKAKGGLLVTVHDAYERWTEVEGDPNLTGHRFGIPEIDDVMNFGLLPSQIMVLMARTGAGKTIVTINMMYRMIRENPNLKILYISLEQTRNEWFERAHRIHNFYHPNATVNDTMRFWADNLLMIDKNRLSADQVETSIDQYAYETGSYPDIFVIDYLGYFARSYPGEEYSRITSAIMDAKAIAKDRKISGIIPHQANRQGNFGREFTADQGRGGGTVEETADLMMGLWAPDQAEGVDQNDMQRQLHLKIMKARDTGVNTKAIMQFAPLSLAVLPMSDPLFNQAAREVGYARAGDTWQEAISRHATGDQNVSIEYPAESF